MINSIRIKIRNLYYKIFYRKTGDKVMGAIANCEAYKNYKSSVENADKILKYSVKEFMDDMDDKINISVVNGKFKACKMFFFGIFNKEQQKYIKSIYKEKGYKVRIYPYWELFIGFYLKFTVSWKHWSV